MNPYTAVFVAGVLTGVALSIELVLLPDVIWSAGYISRRVTRTSKATRCTQEEVKYMNKVMLIGNLTHDPRTRKLPSGDTVASFSIATNFRFRDAETKLLKEDADFHDVVAWGRPAEVVERYLKKGAKVYVEGRLKTREYTAKDGTKVRKPEIVLGSLEMLSPKAERPAEEQLAPEEPEVVAEEAQV